MQLYTYIIKFTGLKKVIYEKYFLQKQIVLVCFVDAEDV